MSLTATIESITATWSASPSSGDAPITAYTATATPGNKTYTTSGLSCTVSGLSPATAYTAADSRSDLAAIFGYGSGHGFNGSVPAPTGVYSMCVFGINYGQGGNVLLGCRQVTLR